MAEINVSNVACNYYDPSFGYQNEGSFLEIITSKRMPCSYNFVSNYATKGVYFCNQFKNSQFQQLNEDRAICDDFRSMGSMSANVTHEGSYLITVDQATDSDPTAFNTTTLNPYNTNVTGTYRLGTTVALDPNSDLFVGVGFAFNPGFYPNPSVTCNFTISSTIHSCPLGQVAITNGAPNLNGAVCVAQQNISVASDKKQSVTFTASQQVTKSIVQLNNIPMNASSIVVNITLPFSVQNATTATPLVSGASYLVAASASSSTQSAFDCGLSASNPYVTGSAPFQYDTDGATYYTYIMICYAPKWNSSFYIAADLTPVTTLGVAWSISTQVVTCPAGKTGMHCTDPLDHWNVLNPTAAGYGFTTTLSSSPMGYYHFYFDMPTNYWNASLLKLSVTTGQLCLRQNTYSSAMFQYDKTWKTNTGGGGSKVNYFYNINNYVDSIPDCGQTLISSPFERFSVSRSNRWVVTYSCNDWGAITSFTPCNFTVTASYPVVTTAPQAPISSAPLSPVPISSPVPPTAPVATPVPIATPSLAPVSSVGGTPASTGIAWWIILAAVGGGVVLLAIIVGVSVGIWWRKKKAKRTQQ